MKKLNASEKYQRLHIMKSVGQFTRYEYPTLAEFKRALRENRVAGDYNKKIVIVSQFPYSNYTFTLG